jgi:vacuolar protein sorting-associated protein 13A/C
MAKSLLLNVLVDTLGNYVEGLSKENLKLGVWSGKIELFNLKLKNSALDNLNLPIQVSRGSLKKLKLKIPWTQLESKPVRVIIDGVYLQAGPLDLFHSSAEDIRKTLHASKLQRLKETDSSIMATLVTSEGLHEKARKATYVQQLTAKIVDNIEITLTNVHIRYEDSVSIPGTTFSTGITIDSLSLSTTDENWSVAFISREIEAKIASAIHKLGVMENLGVYWNQSSLSLLPLDYSAWEDAMQSLIFCNEKDTTGSTTEAVITRTGSALPPALQSMNYMLLPPNKLSVRIKHRDASTELDPKVDVVVDSSTLPFCVDSVQYSQLMALGQALGELDRKRFLALSRPKARPTKDPRAWWFYAYQLVTGRELSTSSKVSCLPRPSHFALCSFIFLPAD